VAVLASQAAASGLAGVHAEREGLRKEASNLRGAADAGGVFQSEAREAAADVALLREQSRGEQLFVRSPIEGRVLTRRMNDLAGRFLAAGAPVAEIGDCRRLKAEIPVTERLLSYLRPGSPVSLQLRARPAHILHGSIVQVGSAAATMPRTADGGREALRPADMPERFLAIVEFDNADGLSLPGMSGRAKITLGRKSYFWRTWRVLSHWLQTVIWW
jgi:multidrug resistance efflux pump